MVGFLWLNIMTYIGEFSLENLVPGVKNHGVNTNEPVDFDGAPSVALPLNTTVNGQPIGGGTTLPGVDFGTIAGYDPTGMTQGNWHGSVTLTGSPTVISSGFTNPSKPRNIYVNDQNGAGAGIFTFHGTDALGASITEAVDLSVINITAKCFATLTSINCPASNGNSFDFSTGSSMGLPATHTNPYIVIPLANGVSQITSDGLQKNWTMTATIDPSVVSNNSITIGNFAVAMFDFIIYVVTQ